MIPLTSTDPSSIANLARCWAMCLGGSSQTSVKTYLLTKTADIATPPCITPTAPSQPVAFQTLDNILKIRWTQPANSGSLIMSYTISWGTTQGGPYTSSETIAGGATRQAILNGLTSGTTYYFVVKANSFAGCSSANSAEGSAATTGTPPSNKLLSGLVSYWKFDDVSIVTAIDSIGPNPLTLRNNSAGNAAASGTAGGEINGYLDIHTGGSCGAHTSNAGFNLVAGQSITFSGWVFSSGWPASIGFLWSKYNEVGGAEYFLDWNNTVPSLQWGAIEADGVTTVRLNVANPTANAWHHVVCGYDGVNNQLFCQFDNGARQTIAMPSVHTTATDFTCGEPSNMTTYNGIPGGGVDELGLWSRVLSTADVALLYNGGAGLPLASFQP